MNLNDKAVEALLSVPPMPGAELTQEAADVLARMIEYNVARKESDARIKKTLDENPDVQEVRRYRRMLIGSWGYTVESEQQAKNIFRQHGKLSDDETKAIYPLVDKIDTLRKRLYDDQKQELAEFSDIIE